MINILKLHHELEAAGFPVCSVRDVDPVASGQPIADYTRPLTAVEQDAANAVIAAHDPTPDPPPPSEPDQITALSNHVVALQSALDLVTTKMVAGSLMTQSEAQGISTATSLTPKTPIKTVT